MIESAQAGKVLFKVTDNGYAAEHADGRKFISESGFCDRCPLQKDGTCDNGGTEDQMAVYKTCHAMLGRRNILKLVEPEKTYEVGFNIWLNGNMNGYWKHKWTMKQIEDHVREVLTKNPSAHINYTVTENVCMYFKARNEVTSKIIIEKQ